MNNTVSAASVAAKNKAIRKYLIAQTKALGVQIGRSNPTILLPEFQEVNGEWQPVESNGIRPTKNGKSSFIRLGMIVDKGGEIIPMFTNTFKDTEKLEDYIDLYDLRIGDKVNGTLIVEESLVPFNRNNPAQDIKWADQAAGIACKVDNMPIYRRVVWTTKEGATSNYITHTNRDEISANASSKWAGNNNANSAAIRNAGAANLKGLNTKPATQDLETELDELLSIKASKRTPEQKARIAELEELGVGA